MAAYSNYPLYVPASLMADLRVAAEREGVSINSFILQAVSEKVATLRARGLLVGLSPAEQSAALQARAVRAQPGSMADILAKAGTPGLVLPGDEIPDGWLEADGEVQDDPTILAAATRPQSSVG